MSRSSRRKKHISKPKKLTEQERKARAVKALIAVITVVLLIVAAVLVFYFMDQSKNREMLEDFEARAESLHAELISDVRQDEMGSFKAAGAPEDVVFLSICDKTQRATVFPEQAATARPHGAMHTRRRTVPSPTGTTPCG